MNASLSTTTAIAEPTGCRPLSCRPAPTVRLLPAEQIDSRLRRLQEACDLLADGFDGFDQQIAEYVSSTPLPPGNVRGADAEKFLDWLQNRVDLDDEQRDYVTALRGRHAVEFVAVKQRLAHARFQELLSRTAGRLDELDSNRKLTIYLNPIHVWSQFETRALLDNDAEVPATVLFVPCGADVRTVVVELEARELIEDLENSGPMRLSDLLRRTARNGQQRCLAILRQLAGIGVIALG